MNVADIKTWVPVTRNRRSPKKGRTIPELPDPPSEEESVSIMWDIRRTLFLNGFRIMWREMKIMYIFIIGIIFIHIFLLGSDVPEARFFFIALYLSMPIMMIDAYQYNCYRLTMFLRTDANYSFPSLLQKRAIVENNIRRYIITHAFLVMILLALLPLFSKYAEYTIMESALILLNLLLLKFFMYTMLNLIETRKRRDLVSDMEDILHQLVMILALVVYLLFDFFLVFNLIPGGSFPLFPVFLSPLVTIPLTGTILLSYFLWSMDIIPYFDDYWQEDRIPLPAFYFTPAVRNNPIFGEEVRELDSSSDVMKRVKVYGEDRIGFSERGEGIRAVMDKCTTVFLREQLNLFLSFCIPAVLILVFFYPVLGEDWVFLLMVIGEILILFFCYTIASGNPLMQEPYALAQTRLLPIPGHRIVQWAILQAFLAGVVGIILFSIMINAVFEPFNPFSHPRELMIALITVLAAAIIMTLANIHLKHNYYPRNIQRTAAQSLPYLFTYLGMIIGYMFLVIFTMIESSGAFVLYVIFTTMILFLGPALCLRLYSTMSIH